MKIRRFSQPETYQSGFKVGLISPDGNRFISGQDDGKTLVWDNTGTFDFTPAPELENPKFRDI